MRKISSVEEEKKKKQRNQVIVGIVLIAVMLFSTLSYAFQGGDSSSKKIIYKGFQFVNQNNYWILQKEGIDFLFFSNPKELPEINSKVNFLTYYTSQPLYLSSSYSEVNSEIYANLGKVVTRIQFACLENSTCIGDFPIKNCDSNFIIIEESNETNIVQDKNCVYIKGEKENLIKLTDLFLLKVLGVA